MSHQKKPTKLVQSTRFSFQNLLSFFFTSRAQKTKHKHQTPITNKYLREEDPDFAKRTIVVDDAKRFDPSSDSEDDAPDFDYLLKLPSSTGSHFILKSEQEKFVDASADFTKHFVIDTNILNLAIKSIPFNERHDIKNIEWSSAELTQMKDEAEANEKIYRDALEKILFDEKQKSEEKLARKVEALKISKETKTIPHQSSSTAPKDNKEAIQDWLDDILDMWNIFVNKNNFLIKL